MTRRIWAKKGILIGSFLGATLVTALLTIVPLYEDSVRAIDLLFTVRSAPDDQVDVEAFVSTTDYQASEAATNRALIEAQQPIIDEWFPEIIERTATREFVFIPITGAIDWIALADQWRVALAEAEKAIEEAGENLAAIAEIEIPAAPYPSPPREPTTARVITAPDMIDHVEILEGQWPVLGDSSVLEVALGENLARLANLGVGDEVILRPFTAVASQFEVVQVAAIVRALDPGDRIWGINEPTRSIHLPQDVFDTWSGAISVAPVTDPWLRDVRGFPGLIANQRWFMPFDRESLVLEEVETVRGAINGFNAIVARDAAIQSRSGLLTLLDEFDVRSVVFGAPIFAMLALIVGGALYFLVYTASLTLEREAPEMALLRTRGASTWQTVGIHLAQSAVIGGLAALLAPTVARFMVGATGRIPPLSDLTGGEPLRVATTDPVWPFVLIGALVTFLAMGLAILPMARRSVLELRFLSARPSHKSVWQRYNLDLFAIVLSGVFLGQLVQTGFVRVEDRGGATLDPLAVVSPALFLFAGSLLLLRILPWLLRFTGWIMTKFRGMKLALPGWHLGRNPVPYGRLALLVWLTIGFGAFALTYAQTLESSFDDRAAFAAGADARLVAENVGYVAAPDGDVGAAVLRTTGAPRLSSRRAEVLAIRPDEFSEVVKWRSDFGAPEPERLFSLLRLEGQEPDLGVVLADDAEELLVDGLVLPRPWALQDRDGDDAPSEALRVLARVFDGAGRPWTIAADVDLTDDQWATATIPLNANAALNRGGEGAFVTPVRLQAVWVERSAPEGGALLRTGAVLLDDFRVVTPGGVQVIDEVLLAELEPFQGLSIDTDVPGNRGVDAYYSQLPTGAEEPTAAQRSSSPLNRDGEVMMWRLPTRTRLADTPYLGKAPQRLRVLLDTQIAAIAGLNVGDRAEFGVGPDVIPGEMVGFIDRVPTMTDRTTTGNMIIDLDALSLWFNGVPTWSFTSNLARIDGPGELWIKTDRPDAAIRQVTGAYGEEVDMVFTARGAAADFSSRPVQVGLVAILFVGAATGVILALAGVTGYVLLAVSRRAREMGVLRALGFARTGVAATFAVEQIVVLGLGAVVGVAGGIGLMRIMVPFLQLGETATDIQPPVLLRFDPQILGLYVVVVAMLLIISVVWATRRVSVRRMSEVLREVER